MVLICKFYKNQIFPDKTWCKKQIHLTDCLNSNKLYHDSNALFYNGILFAHDLNTKGTIFTDFYATYAQYLKNHNMKLPKKVIFIDDALHNIHSLEEAVSKLGIKFYGYHMDHLFTFDPAQAYEEEDAVKSALKKK